jgi:DNA-binding LytR/AlgR family response regulator
MKILIIEDEQPAARQLIRLLQQLEPAPTIIEVLDSVETAVRWIKTFPTPDLIMMDIQIADGLSFEIFRQVEVPCPVIFTTAYDQYALQAFKVNAVDYLLKPVEPEALYDAIKRYQERQKAHSGPFFDVEMLYQHYNQPSYKDRFLVRTGQQMVSIRTQEIAFFRSSDGLTQAHTAENKKYFVDHALDELERLLDPAHYFRVSRHLMIRQDAVKAIHPHLNGRLKLDTTPAAPEEVFVSRDRAGAFKTWLGG